MHLAILPGQFNIQHLTFNIAQEIPCLNCAVIQLSAGG